MLLHPLLLLARQPRRLHQVVDVERYAFTEGTRPADVCGWSR